MATMQKSLVKTAFTLFNLIPIRTRFSILYQIPSILNNLSGGSDRLGGKTETLFKTQFAVGMPVINHRSLHYIIIIVIQRHSELTKV